MTEERPHPTRFQPALPPRLDQAAMHGLAGEVVSLLEPHTESDPAARLVSFLVAFGSALNAGPHIVADGARHPARLFAVVVGATSKSRKGTSWRNIARVFEVADDDWTRKRVLSGLSSGEGLIAAVGDGTPDKDGNRADAVTDKRLLVVEEEFARVLAVCRREGNILSPLTRQAWDDGNLRSMTRQPQSATGAHVSILGHITVEELRRELNDTAAANGFANRFLFLHASRSKLLPSGGTLGDSELVSVGQRVGEALRRARTIGRVRRTPEAEKEWDSLYRQMAEEDPGGLVGAVTARDDAQTLRLSLVYALIDGSNVIDVPHIEAASALWRYCRDSAAYVFGDRLGDDVADRLLAVIRRAGDAGVDYTEQSKALGRHFSSKAMANARQVLEEHGYIRTVTIDDTGGRPRTLSVAKEANYAN